MRHQLNCCISSSMQHFSYFRTAILDDRIALTATGIVPGRSESTLLRLTKKNAGRNAGVGIQLQEGRVFFRRIRHRA